MASSDAEDEDLKAAIAMSLGEQTNGPILSSGKMEMTSQQSSGIAGLDRRAMEQERLFRQNLKREREVSPPPYRNDSRKAPKLEEKTFELPSGARIKSFSSLVNGEQKGRKSEIANTATQHLQNPTPPATIKGEPADDSMSTYSSSVPGSIQYPNGTVKKTWAFKFPRTGDDIKLEEVLEPQTLRTAVLSAFQWNTDWVLSKLKIPPNGGTTKCVFVMQAEGDKLREEMLQQTEDMRPFLRLCFPPMEGQIHCMHSKLMLLFHPEKLRIAIPTANLLDFDWGDTGVMENSVFMIDLPRLPEGGKAEVEELTPFAKEMLHYLDLQGLDEMVRKGVLNFDFSATKDMAFVHTAGGVHYGEDTERTGLLGLAQAVRKLNLQTGEDLEIDFAASSIGSLKDDQLHKLHAAARGEDLIQREKDTEAKAKANFFKKKEPTSKPTANIRNKIRIYFPTEETVTSSIAGAAGTICLNRRWYEDMPFPRPIFRDYVSTRTGLLSHNKILYARGKQTQPDGTKKDVAWCYVGSANMSESAWGKISFDKKEKAWKISCRNWECGVLLPVSGEVIDEWRQKKIQAVKKEEPEEDGSETEVEDDDETDVEEGASKGDARKEEIVGMEVFDGIVKPPFVMPGRKYEGREPWYFQEKR